MGVNWGIRQFVTWFLQKVVHSSFCCYRLGHGHAEYFFIYICAIKANIVYLSFL